MKPLAMAPNLIDHYYRGGGRIAALRRAEATSLFQPEEWVASTVSRADNPVAGPACGIDGTPFIDLVTANHEAWVGPGAAQAASPKDVGILFKLLDARQRLPVHVHPSRPFSLSHLDCPYGKTEAWLILDTEPDAAVYLGWNTEVDPEELAIRRDAQDSEWMLSRMNRIVVEPGMGVVVPAGTAHSIDSGVFLTEVQEPADLSILLEWSVTTSTREESHLGLGFDTVMSAVSTSRMPQEMIERLVTRNDLNSRHGAAVSLLSSEADDFFRLYLAAPNKGAQCSFDAGFAVALVLDGTSTMTGADGSITAEKGNVFAVPHSFGPWQIVGKGTVLVGTPGLGWPHTLNGRNGRK